MSEQEQAFFDWFAQVNPHMDKISIRMAFDAGWEAARKGE